MRDGWTSFRVAYKTRANRRLSFDLWDPIEDAREAQLADLRDRVADLEQAAFQIAAWVQTEGNRPAREHTEPVAELDMTVD
ncbi:MAG TPA: hypothetical protein VGN43_01605 [Steroidobacteraceae bacterium]|jgi:hypothetical protein|nr:hypothetical protein [Steroidobacteraceae bacterium]